MTWAELYQNQRHRACVLIQEYSSYSEKRPMSPVGSGCQELIPRKAASPKPHSYCVKSLKRPLWGLAVTYWGQPVLASLVSCGPWQGWGPWVAGHGSCHA